jgi:queuine/archaeosine tRNA-ribosyltransferase
MKVIQNERQLNIELGGLSIALPCFIPSISSVKTNLSLIEYLRVITAIEYPLLLASAYDIYNTGPERLEKIKQLLETAMKKEIIVLIDSGNYESYWLRDNSWNVNHYRDILKNVKHQLAFCYDYLELNGDAEKLSCSIEKQVLEDQTSSEGTIIPIVHASKELFPEIISQLVDKLNPLIIGLPERQLGEGIIERAKTVTRIRQKLNQKNQYYPLHLLGTGNPLSILVYAICGADSFDGLEWCQTAINHNTGLLYHFQQREFFEYQTDICKTIGLPYDQCTLVQNLQFYIQWMQKIHNRIVENNIIEMIDEYFPKSFVMQLRKQLREVLKC